MIPEEKVFSINSDIEADNLLTEIQDLHADKNRFEMIANAKISSIRDELLKKEQAINTDIEFKKAMLRAYFNTVKAKETKTQKTYTLLSGNLVLKKPFIALEHDDTKILQWAKENGKEYVKEVPKLDWNNMKKNLIVDENNKIINKSTGEILSIEGLSTKENPEKFDIKI